MSLRQLCKKTAKRASKALFLFPEEEKTGIAPTRLIVEKDLEFTEGQSVHVVWGGKKVKAKILAVSGKYQTPAPTMVTSSSASPSPQNDVVTVLHQRLASKTEECRQLMNKLDAMEEANSKILFCQMQMQENFVKMLEKIETSMSIMEGKLLKKMSALEDKVGVVEANLEVRLDALTHYSMLDTTVTDEIPVLDNTMPIGDDQALTTINTDTLNRLREEVQPAETSQIVHPAITAASSTLEVGEELIGTCVTPTKIKTVQQTLEKESEQHLCALKLLQSFFTAEELATSNTDGSYGKKCLDSNKLNSLKVLLFTKFPVVANEEKEKVWKTIKGKINTKCRVIRKFAQRDDRSL